VRHRPYVLSDATLETLSESVTSSVGVDILGREPVSVLFSPGVDVEVLLFERVR
jgi:hypothetical protein